jgi:hypothetical protein
MSGEPYLYNFKIYPKNLFEVSADFAHSPVTLHTIFQEDLINDIDQALQAAVSHFPNIHHKCKKVVNILNSFQFLDSPHKVEDGLKVQANESAKTFPEQYIFGDDKNLAKLRIYLLSIPFVHVIS